MISVRITLRLNDSRQRLVPYWRIKNAPDWVKNDPFTVQAVYQAIAMKPHLVTDGPITTPLLVRAGLRCDVPWPGYIEEVRSDVFLALGYRFGRL